MKQTTQTHEAQHKDIPYLNTKDIAYRYFQ